MNSMLKKLPLLFLVLSVLGCQSATESALQDRAQGFGDLLVELRELSEDTALERLEEFVEPTDDTEDQVWEYYEDFSEASEKWRVMSHSIVRIRVHDDQESATVMYETVMRGEDRELPVEQETYWALVEGTWYRTLEDSKKRLG